MKILYSIVVFLLFMSSALTQDVSQKYQLVQTKLLCGLAKDALKDIKEAEFQPIVIGNKGEQTTMIFMTKKKELMVLIIQNVEGKSIACVGAIAENVDTFDFPTE